MEGEMLFFRSEIWRLFFPFCVRQRLERTEQTIGEISLVIAHGLIRRGRRLNLKRLSERVHCGGMPKNVAREQRS
jgi:hypothetical protein